MRLLAASSLSVCLSVRMEELDSHRADVRENLYWGFLMVFIETYQFLWKWAKISDLRTFIITFAAILIMVTQVSVPLLNMVTM